MGREVFITKPDMSLHRRFAPVIRRSGGPLGRILGASARILSFAEQIIEKYQGIHFYDFDYSSFVFLDRLMGEQEEEEEAGQQLAEVTRALSVWNVFRQQMHVTAWQNVTNTHERVLTLLKRYGDLYPRFFAGDSHEHRQVSVLNRYHVVPYVASRSYHYAMLHLQQGNRIESASVRMKRDFERQMVFFNRVQEEYVRLFEELPMAVAAGTDAGEPRALPYSVLLSELYPERGSRPEEPACPVSAKRVQNLKESLERTIREERRISQLYQQFKEQTSRHSLNFEEEKLCFIGMIRTEFAPQDTAADLPQPPVAEPDIQNHYELSENRLENLIFRIGSYTEPEWEQLRERMERPGVREHWLRETLEEAQRALPAAEPENVVRYEIAEKRLENLVRRISRYTEEERRELLIALERPESRRERLRSILETLVTREGEEDGPQEEAAARVTPDGSGGDGGEPERGGDARIAESRLERLVYWVQNLSGEQWTELKERLEEPYFPEEPRMRPEEQPENVVRERVEEVLREAASVRETLRGTRPDEETDAPMIFPEGRGEDAPGEPGGAHPAAGRLERLILRIDSLTVEQWTQLKERMEESRVREERLTRVREELGNTLAGPPETYSEEDTELVLRAERILTSDSLERAYETVETAAELILNPVRLEQTEHVAERVRTVTEEISRRLLLWREGADTPRGAADDAGRGPEGAQAGAPGQKKEEPEEAGEQARAASERLLTEVSQYITRIGEKPRLLLTPGDFRMLERTEEFFLREREEKESVRFLRELEVLARSVRSAESEEEPKEFQEQWARGPLVHADEGSEERGALAALREQTEQIERAAEASRPKDLEAEQRLDLVRREQTEHLAERVRTVTEEISRRLLLWRDGAGAPRETADGAGRGPEEAQTGTAGRKSEEPKEAGEQARAASERLLTEFSQYITRIGEKPRLLLTPGDFRMLERTEEFFLREREEKESVRFLRELEELTRSVRSAEPEEELQEQWVRRLLVHLDEVIGERSVLAALQEQMEQAAEASRPGDAEAERRLFLDMAVQSREALLAEPALAGSREYERLETLIYQVRQYTPQQWQIFRENVSGAGEQVRLLREFRTYINREAGRVPVPEAAGGTENVPVPSVPGNAGDSGFAGQLPGAQPEAYTYPERLLSLRPAAYEEPKESRAADAYEAARRSLPVLRTALKLQSVLSDMEKLEDRPKDPVVGQLLEEQKVLYREYTEELRGQRTKVLEDGYEEEDVPRAADVERVLRSPAGRNFSLWVQDFSELSERHEQVARAVSRYREFLRTHEREDFRTYREYLIRCLDECRSENRRLFSEERSSLQVERVLTSGEGRRIQRLLKIAQLPQKTVEFERVSESQLRTIRGYDREQWTELITELEEVYPEAQRVLRVAGEAAGGGFVSRTAPVPSGVAKEQPGTVPAILEIVRREREIRNQLLSPVNLRREEIPGGAEAAPVATGAYPQAGREVLLRIRDTQGSAGQGAQPRYESAEAPEQSVRTLRYESEAQPEAGSRELYYRIVSVPGEGEAPREETVVYETPERIIMREEAPDAVVLSRNREDGGETVELSAAARQSRERVYRQEREIERLNTVLTESRDQIEKLVEEQTKLKEIIREQTPERSRSESRAVIEQRVIQRLQGEMRIERMRRGIR